MGYIVKYEIYHDGLPSALIIELIIGPHNAGPTTASTTYTPHTQQQHILHTQTVSQGYEVNTHSECFSSLGSARPDMQDQDQDRVTGLRLQSCHKTEVSDHITDVFTRPIVFPALLCGASFLHCALASGAVCKWSCLFVCVCL